METHMKKMPQMNKRGQLAGVLFGFLIVATLAILMQPLLSFIEIGVNATQNATHGAMMGTIINVIPLFFWLVALIAVVGLITGRQQ